MQSAALAKLGLAPEWSYEAIEVPPERLESLVGSLPGQGFVGVNVTVPHKLAALALADEASAAARAIGAANTLTFSGGRIAAENTDATGLLDALADPPRGRRALVMGAGGSARACAWALREGGAEVWIWNRTPERAGALAADLGVSALAAEDQADVAERFDLLVNATTVGMGETSATGGAQLKALPLGADGLSERHVVVDLAYGPRETELSSAARARGATVIDGLEVLVRQGAASLALWTGMEPPIETMRQAARV
jgi:shikimate dehydrogenase